MSKSDFDWESLLNTRATEGVKLLAALFTTFDRPDARLLAEHVLPALFGLQYSPDGEGLERAKFLVDLDDHLKCLHDRIVIVSSAVGDETMELAEGDDSTYGWIWNSIRRAAVGRDRKAVQHAKLWLLHWSDGGEEPHEYLEIVVSSCNLTRSGFRKQLQGGWRALVPLQPKRSETRLTGWGILPAFLNELAISADCVAQCVSFTELLARAVCPEGVTFVASVPGQHSRNVLRRTPWGVAGLATLVPPGRGKVKLSVLAPFVGSWTNESLGKWCEMYGGAPERLELAWIRHQHPWAITNCWRLPTTSHAALIAAKATLLELPVPDAAREGGSCFHPEHRDAHLRWCHAKVYGLERGNARWLLITSANFSSAAWGGVDDSGNLTIENFELGVCVPGVRWPFHRLEPFYDPNDAATVVVENVRATAVIMWARAAWDGKRVLIEYRAALGAEIAGSIFDGEQYERVVAWNPGEGGAPAKGVDKDSGLRMASVPWATHKRPPRMVELTCRTEDMTIAVFDERPASEREATLPPELDPEFATRLRDTLLFERYGGVVPDDLEDIETEEIAAECAVGEDVEGGNSGAEDFSDDPQVGDCGNSKDDGYRMPATERARQHFKVVDGWATFAKRAMAQGGNEFERSLCERDGVLLIEAFNRQVALDVKTRPTQGIGARLAGEELSGRVRLFKRALLDTVAKLR